MGTLQSGPHDLCRSSAVKGVVHTPLGHSSSNVFLDRTINLLGIHKISGYGGLNGFWFCLFRFKFISYTDHRIG